MYILFDIGGTNTRVASAQDDLVFRNPVIFDTPLLYEEGTEKLIETIEGLAGGDPIVAIIGGIAGPWDKASGSMVSSTNLPDWVGKPLQIDLEKACSARVIIENDSAMVGLGEAVYGAGREYGIVAYVTVSTGVGGAKIVDGMIDKKSVGFEPGKMIIDAHGDTLENLISGKAVEAKTHKKPADIDDPAYWDSLAKILAVGLNNIIVTWSPEVVVVGGSMMKAHGIPIEFTEDHLANIFIAFPHVPPIRKAELGDLGGLYGGLAMIKTL